jgi:amino acid transporter
MNKNILNLIPSIILYIFAGLLAAYAIWSYTYCADIISQAKAAGQLAASGNEYDIASFYMGNCGQYAVFVLLLAAAGIMLQRKPLVQNASVTAVPDTKKEIADGELDEWFSETETENNIKLKE